MDDKPCTIVVTLDGYENTDEWWEEFRHSFHIAVDRCYDSEDLICKLNYK